MLTFRLCMDDTVVVAIRYPIIHDCFFYQQIPKNYLPFSLFESLKFGVAVWFVIKIQITISLQLYSNKSTH